MTALDRLGTKANLVFGTPSPAADENAFAVTKATRHEVQPDDAVGLRGEVLWTGHDPGRPAGVPAAPVLPAGSGEDVRHQVRPVQDDGRRRPDHEDGADQTGEATIGLVFSSDSSLVRAVRRLTAGGESPQTFAALFRTCRKRAAGRLSDYRPISSSRPFRLPGTLE